MAPPARRHLPRGASMDSAKKGAYSTATQRPANTDKNQPTNTAEKSYEKTTKTANMLPSVQKKSHTASSRRETFPNLLDSAAYGNKEVDSNRLGYHEQVDEDEEVDEIVDGEADEEASEDDSHEHSPRRKRDSARRTILEKDKNYFARQRAQKKKRERKAAAAVTAATDAEDSITVATRPATNKGKGKETETAKLVPASAAAIANDHEEKSGVTPGPATNLPAGKKGKTKKSTQSRATAPTAQGSTLQGGNIVNPVVVPEQTKAKRPHRPKVFEYDSAPDSSEKEEGNATIAKLRETVDRHAKWCPFVRFNKKIQHMHRRMKRLEATAAKNPPSDKDEGGKSKAVKARGPGKRKSKANEKDESDEDENGRDDGGKTEGNEDHENGMIEEVVDEGAKGGDEQESQAEEEEEDQGDEDEELAGRDYRDHDDANTEDQPANDAAAATDENKQSSRSKQAPKGEEPASRKASSKTLSAVEKRKAQKVHDSEDDDDMAAYGDSGFTQSELFELTTAEAAQTAGDDSPLSTVPDDFASDAYHISIPDTAFEKSFKSHELEEKKRKKGKAKRGSLATDKAALTRKRKATTDEPAAEEIKKRTRTTRSAKLPAAEH